MTFHVLEHLTSIHQIFKKFKLLLQENGILIIEVPFLNANKEKAPFRTIGAVHPLGFSKKFFEINMPKEGFNVDFKGGLIICSKTKNASA